MPGACTNGGMGGNAGGICGYIIQGFTGKLQGLASALGDFPAVRACCAAASACVAASLKCAACTSSSAAAVLASRPPLPGIPSYVDRVSAEEIWKDFCHSEKDYFERIKHNPPKTRENYGVLYGFEVIKHPTYTSALRINSPTSSVASSRARTPSVIGDGKALGTVTTGPTQASRARAMPSVTRRKELPSFTTSINNIFHHNYKVNNHANKITHAICS